MYTRPTPDAYAEIDARAGGPENIEFAVAVEVGDGWDGIVEASLERSRGFEATLAVGKIGHD